MDMDSFFEAQAEVARKDGRLVISTIPETGEQFRAVKNTREEALDLVRRLKINGHADAHIAE